MAIAGKSAVVLMSGRNLSLYLNSVDVSQSGNALESTVFASSGNKEYIGGGLKDATISGDGLFDGNNIDSTLNSALASTAKKVWTHWPDGTSTGKYGFGMETYETKYDIKTPLEEVVSMSIEAQSNVGRDRIISLFGLSNITATSGNSAVLTGSSSVLGGVGYIQRTDTGSRTLTGYIQHSSGSTYANLISFTASTAKTGQRIATNSTAIKKNLRFKYNINVGTTKPVTVNAGFYRK